MGNRDHIQRANADKESCQNCCHSDTLFRDFPCNVCKGTNDMFEIDSYSPPILTGYDLGMLPRKKPDPTDGSLREDPGFISGVNLLETPRKGAKVVYVNINALVPVEVHEPEPEIDVDNCIQPSCYGSYSEYMRQDVNTCAICEHNAMCLDTLRRRRDW